MASTSSVQQQTCCSWTSAHGRPRCSASRPCLRRYQPTLADDGRPDASPPPARPSRCRLCTPAHHRLACHVVHHFDGTTELLISLPWIVRGSAGFSSTILARGRRRAPLGPPRASSRLQRRAQTSIRPDELSEEDKVTVARARVQRFAPADDVAEVFTGLPGVTTPVEDGRLRSCVAAGDLDDPPEQFNVGGADVVAGRRAPQVWGEIDDDDRRLFSQRISCSAGEWPRAIEGGAYRSRRATPAQARPDRRLTSARPMPTDRACRPRRFAEAAITRCRCRDVSEAADHIDVERAQAALTNARAALADDPFDPAAIDAVRRAELRLDVAGVVTA